MRELLKKPKKVEIETNVRIIGGEKVEIGKYPFMVGLVYDGEVRCGGSLIAPTLVLSAAHCGVSTFGQIRPPDFAIINCKKKYLNPEEPECERIAIESVDIHENYDHRETRFDVMILLLAEPSKNEVVHLSRIEPTLHQEVTTIGWGKTEAGNVQGSDDLLEVNISAVSREYCNNQYRIGLSSLNDIALEDMNPNVVDDSMVCAARSDADACEGDSGGPLFIQCPQQPQNIQVGIVSFGIGCALPGFPGVYANVANEEILEFIETVAGTLSQNVSIIDSLPDSCVHSPDENIAPTSFPTFPVDWSCDLSFFNSNDGCDCRCGIQDPDCEKPDQKLYNCDNDNEVCYRGECTTEPEVFSVEEDEKATVYFLVSVAVCCLCLLCFFCFCRKYKNVDETTAFKQELSKKVKRKRSKRKIHVATVFTAEELAVNSRFDL